MTFSRVQKTILKLRTIINENRDSFIEFFSEIKREQLPKEKANYIILSEAKRFAVIHLGAYALTASIHDLDAWLSTLEAKEKACTVISSEGKNCGKPGVYHSGEKSHLCKEHLAIVKKMKKGDSCR